MQAFTRLKGFRAEQGLTQKQMAETLGMNEDTYRKRKWQKRIYSFRSS